MEIKEFHGSISIDDFLDGLTAYGTKKETLGDVWETCVDCNHCRFREQCHALCDQIEEAHNVNIHCGQVVDYLLGDKTLEEIIKEAD